MKTKLLIILSLTLVIHAYAGSATWNLNPATGDWNTASNWTPATVPNSHTDIATFDASNTTSVVTAADVDLADLVFTAAAPPYTINVGFTFYGEGVRNDSGVSQTLNGGFTFNGRSSAGDNVTYNTSDPVSFNDNATAGSATIYSTVFAFEDNSTAGDATIVSDRLTNAGDEFGGTSSAGNAHITLLGSSEGLAGAVLFLEGKANADHGTFIAEPTTVAGGYGADIEVQTFVQPLNGGTFIADGSAISNGGFPNAAGIIQMESDAGAGTFVINGATTPDGEGGKLTISGSAGAAFITANGGENGGSGGNVTLTKHSTGGTARIAVYGNGFLNSNVLDPGAVIGSLEGDGLVELGKKSLILGSNNLSTTFSGDISGTGAITKIGTGTLTLTGTNTYSGGTTVTSGILLVSSIGGSGTGTGVVSVNAGTLGGSGIITGAVTVGPGGFLAPASGTNKQVTLTLQNSLTLQAGATYTYTFRANKNKARTDLVVANGVTINNAALAITGTTQGRMKRGTVLTVISNTSANPISGAFSNLADGAIITVNGNNLQASYEGGDGNDLTLTVVP